MSILLRLLILSILLSFYSLSADAINTSNTPDKKPEVIHLIKKPCYIGCDYLFQFCYYYNISNMKDAITVKEWNIEDDLVTGKAVADIKAKLLIKVCYQLSLTSAYAVVDQDVNLESEFEFRIKLKGDGKNQCIQRQEDAIKYFSFELKGDLEIDPIPLMQGQLEQDMADIIQDSISKEVYEYSQDKNEGKNIYCSEEHNKIYEEDYPCRCD